MFQVVGTALQLTWIAIDHNSCKIFAKTSTTHKRKWDNGQVVYEEAVLFFFFKYLNSLFILKKQSNAFLFAKSLWTQMGMTLMILVGEESRSLLKMRGGVLHSLSNWTQVMEGYGHWMLV